MALKVRRPLERLAVVEKSFGLKAVHRLAPDGPLDKLVGRHARRT
jgi:hypothetical protein